MHEPDANTFNDQAVKKVYIAITGGGRKQGHDGLCPSISMISPRLSNGAILEAMDLSSVDLNTEGIIEPGVWYFEKVTADHLGLVGAPYCRKAQRLFFEALYCRLDRITKNDLRFPEVLPWKC
jgi:hypothetical protein